MSPLTKNPYTFHKYPNSANRNIKKAIKAIKILTFYQQRRTPWYHVCEKQQRANSCHAHWTSNGYSFYRSCLTTSTFLYLNLPIQRELWQLTFRCNDLVISGKSLQIILRIFIKRVVNINCNFAFLQPLRILTFRRKFFHQHNLPFLSEF